MLKSFMKSVSGVERKFGELRSLSIEGGEGDPSKNDLHDLA